MDTCPRFPVEPELDTRHETFQRIFGRAIPRGWTYAETSQSTPSHFNLNPEADSTGLFNLERFRGYPGWESNCRASVSDAFVADRSAFPSRNAAPPSRGEAGLSNALQIIHTPQTTSMTFDLITLRQPGFVPAFLFSTHSAISLREQIRERAPPSLT